jgi:GntR family transcriptional repressor for pyruvate dehydrogenase complex
LDLWSAIVKKNRSLSLALSPGLNRTQELAQRLAAEIRSGRLPPGSRLPTEQELSAETGVSRTVVREAVAALRADGLVTTRQGLGAFVASDVQRWPFRIDANDLKSVSDVLQVIELRMSLEIEASSLAAERHDSVDLAKIEKALAAIVRRSRAAAMRSTPTSSFICRYSTRRGIAIFHNCCNFWVTSSFRAR